jgi:AcrR family transcriptional regulator
MEQITEKKKAIFESTLALVKENGFHGTPMSQVAKKAGVAAGTIYHHFDSKDTLIMELYAYLKNQMLSSLLKDDDAEMNYKDRFFNFFISHCLFYIGHPNALFFMEQFVNSPYSSRDPIQENDRFQQTFKDVIRTGVESRILKPIDYRILASLIHGAIVTTSKIHLCKKINIREDELKQITQVVWDGIRNQAPAAESA